jgi:hypothetical protein
MAAIVPKQGPKNGSEYAKIIRSAFFLRILNAIKIQLKGLMESINSETGKSRALPLGSY